MDRRRLANNLQTENTQRFVITLILFGGLFMVLGVMLYIHAAGTEMLIGQLTAVLLMAGKRLYDSTSSSERKTDLLAKAAPVSDVPMTTTTMTTPTSLTVTTTPAIPPPKEPPA